MMIKCDIKMPDEVAVIDAEFCDRGRIIELTTLYTSIHKKVRKSVVTIDRFNPKRKMNNTVIEYHGIQQKELDDCKPFYHARLRCGKKYIVGHDVRNDKNALMKSGEKVDNFKWICTQKLIRVLFDKKNLSLEKSVELLVCDNRYKGMFEIYKSYKDTYNTAKLYLILCDVAYSRFGQSDAEFMWKLSRKSDATHADKEVKVCVV